MSAPKLKPFSYGILALVGRGGASAHDLVVMMREGTVHWTTSESHYYAEPKRLERLGYLTSSTRAGRTRDRTFYELTAEGREALGAWIGEPAAMPRIQNEAALKLLGADFADDAAVLRSLQGLREELAARLEHVDALDARAAALPHRARYLDLLNELARNTLDAQLRWLEHVEAELGPARTDAGADATSGAGTDGDRPEA
jgi:DNA-binding PadR family transcriptional regulator